MLAMVLHALTCTYLYNFNVLCGAMNAHCALKTLRFQQVQNSAAEFLTGGHFVGGREDGSL